MLEVDTPRDLARYVGKELGVSDWVVIDQERIDKFADATGDHAWVHVDVERARRELPTGTTIAHGFLTLSLVIGLKTYEVARYSRGLNYGTNRVRFTNMVPAGARVRLRQKLLSLDETKDGAFRATIESTMEIEGQAKPALVAETMSVLYP
jgi:acyl dehydratase